MTNHFHPNETEEGPETILEQPELVGDVAKQEEERTQPHDGKDVGEIDNEWVGGDGEDGGDAVDGKDDVGELDDQQDQEERGHVVAAIDLGEEIVSIDLGGDWEETAGKPNGRVVGSIDFFIAFVAEHLDAAVDEDHAKDGQHPRDTFHQGAQEEDEEEAEHNGTQDTPEKDAVVVAFVDAKADENHNHHEDVVDGEGLLEEIAGKVLLEDLFAVDFECGTIFHRGLDDMVNAGRLGIGEQLFHVGDAVNPFGLEEQQEAKEHGKGNPDACPGGSLFHFDDMVLLVENAQVQKVFFIQKTSISFDVPPKFVFAFYACNSVPKVAGINVAFRIKPFPVGPDMKIRAVFVAHCADILLKISAPCVSL